MAELTLQAGEGKSAWSFAVSAPDVPQSSAAVTHCLLQAMNQLCTYLTEKGGEQVLPVTLKLWQSSQYTHRFTAVMPWPLEVGLNDDLIDVVETILASVTEGLAAVGSGDASWSS